MAQIVGEPTFEDNVRELETTDPADPDTWNPIHEVLINNDVYLKQAHEALFWATRYI